MKNLFILIAVLMGTIASAQDKNIHKLETSVFSDSLKAKKVQLVDVRTPEEFAAGHIDGAVNINYLDSQAFSNGIQQLDKNQPVYLYCRSGNRSGKSADTLAVKGFTKIYDLTGGYMGWAEKFGEQ